VRLGGSGSHSHERRRAPRRGEPDHQCRRWARRPWSLSQSPHAFGLALVRVDWGRLGLWNCCVLMWILSLGMLCWRVRLLDFLPHFCGTCLQMRFDEPMTNCGALWDWMFSFFLEILVAGATLITYAKWGGWHAKLPRACNCEVTIFRVVCVNYQNAKMLEWLI